MRHATIADLNAIYGAFQNNREWFPHVRKDKIERVILAGDCVYQEGVVLTYHRNKVAAPVIASSTFRAPAQAVILHWLLNSAQYNGAAGRVFDEFAATIVKPGRMFLSVRADNKVACEFYERHGMKIAAHDGTWSGGTIRGLIYWLQA